MRSAGLGLFLVVSSSAAVSAKDIDKAMAAYHAGNFAAALEELLPLARQGHVLAQYNVGVTYDEGLGDYAEAAKWYRRAAEQGDPMAQTNLGHMYDSGDGVPQDHAEAVNWYRLAAKQGDTYAQSTLGLMHSTGDGVRQDNVKAYMWYNISDVNGFNGGSILRAAITPEMTPAEILQAQAMADECLQSDYTDCGW